MVVTLALDIFLLVVSITVQELEVMLHLGLVDQDQECRIAKEAQVVQVEG